MVNIRARSKLSFWNAKEHNFISVTDNGWNYFQSTIIVGVGRWCAVALKSKAQLLSPGCFESLNLKYLLPQFGTVHMYALCSKFTCSGYLCPRFPPNFWSHCTTLCWRDNLHVLIYCFIVGKMWKASGGDSYVILTLATALHVRVLTNERTMKSVFSRGPILYYSYTITQQKMLIWLNLYIICK